MFRPLHAVTVLWILALTAMAQEASVSTIQSMGEATVDAIPNYADFWLHKKTSGETNIEAVEKASELEAGINAELEKLALSPKEAVLSGMAIGEAAKKEAMISVRLRFNATPYSTAAEGPKDFAKLCDTMNGLAEALGCELGGPLLGTTDEQAVSDAAVARAVEKAYTSAKAAAEVMDSQIYAVNHVEVVGTVWNAAPGVASTQPDIRRLTCTVTVKVAYAFAAAHP
jgi:hypothetical protein